MDETLKKLQKMQADMSERYEVVKNGVALMIKQGAPHQTLNKMIDRKNTIDKERKLIKETIDGINKLLGEVEQTDTTETSAES